MFLVLLYLVDVSVFAVGEKVFGVETFVEVVVDKLLEDSQTVRDLGFGSLFVDLQVVVDLGFVVNKREL